MERLLAIDYGRKRIGLAANDPLGIAAHPIRTLEGAPEQALDPIAALCEEREIDRIILGLPLNMDGSEGPMAKEVRTFGGWLTARTGRPVELFDERLSSFDARQQLRAVKRKKGDKGRIDAVAAARFLKDYMERDA